jgi:hypothetical protein
MSKTWRPPAASNSRCCHRTQRHRELKIVQRISIKIAVDPDDPLAGQLRPGMSVAPMIDTKPPRDTVLSTLVRSKTGDHGLALNR